MAKASGSGVRAMQTRAALIDAGIALFGRRGYDAMTTRAIAFEAETNVSSIKYHFGGKAELYRAALESVASEIRGLLDPLLVTLSTQVRDARKDPAALRLVAHDFAESWCRAVLGDRRLQRRIPLVVRELIAPTESFDVIYHGFFLELYDAIAMLIAGFHDRSPDMTETRIRTHALISLLLGFVEDRSLFWRQMDWKRYTPERIERIVPTVAKTFAAALG